MDNARLSGAFRLCYIVCLLSILLFSECVADINANTWSVNTDFNDTIIETSNTICEGLTNKKAKANAIYSWIRKNVIWNISYMIKHWNRGEVYNIDPASVIETGFGICTDQAAVAYMLLRAQGITSAIAVVNENSHAVCLYMIDDIVYEMDFSACTNKKIIAWEDLPLYYD